MSQQQVIPVRLDDGRVILASVEMLGGEENVAASTLSFDGAVSAIEGIAKQLSRVFDSVKPQKATVEFGVSLSVESGKLTALLVGAKGDASLKIALQWGEVKKSD
ncbi:MAG: CU044_2847 family protein [Planctomycetota bacterium]